MFTQIISSGGFEKNELINKIEILLKIMLIKIINPICMLPSNLPPTKSTQKGSPGERQQEKSLKASFSLILFSFNKTEVNFAPKG